MTDQAPTATFPASSVFDRANADGVDQLAARPVSALVDAGCRGRALLQEVKG